MLITTWHVYIIISEVKNKPRSVTAYWKLLRNLILRWRFCRPRRKPLRDVGKDCLESIHPHLLAFALLGECSSPFFLITLEIRKAGSDLGILVQNRAA